MLAHKGGHTFNLHAKQSISTSLPGLLIEARSLMGRMHVHCHLTSLQCVSRRGFGSSQPPADVFMSACFVVL
jgi:hypothetical protein